MEIVPFKAEHLTRLKAQPSQEGLLSTVTPENAESIELAPGIAYSAIEGDKVLAIAGILEYGDGRGLSWAYLSSDMGNKFVGITRAVKRALEITTCRRVELAADCDFPAAHKWARLLGFTLEAPRMKKYTADGRDCSLYAMVK